MLIPTCSSCRAVSSTELSALEDICKAIIKERQPFERLEVSKDVLLEMFQVLSGSCLEFKNLALGILKIINMDNFLCVQIIAGCSPNCSKPLVITSCSV